VYEYDICSEVNGETSATLGLSVIVVLVL